ncbi:hypothetical protein ACVWZ3_006970 [Bradyrhizobium sp. i1.3.6]
MLHQGPATPVPMARNAAAVDQETPWCEKHHQIVCDEIEAINTRREPERRLDADGLQPCQLLDVVGLALSGGGIRSSAVCLGVLQALNHHNLIGRIDYLSTVSGGGYIGTSLSATMTTARRFVFGERPAGGTVTSAEISDTPSVGHLRNYSNYLIPAGARDLLTGVAIVVRGLVANIGLTLPIVLLLAAITIWSTPLRSCLTDANIFGISLNNRSLCELHDFSDIDRYGFSTFGLVVALVMFACSGLAYFTSRSVRGSGPSVVFAYIGGIALLLGVACDFARFLKVQHFALSLSIAIIGGVLFFGWALKQSLASPGKRQEFRSHWPSMGATFLVLLAVIAFFEFQPFMLEQMFDVAESSAIGGPAAAVAITWIKSLAAVAAPIGVFVTAFRQQFVELLKGNSASSQWGSLVLAVVAKVALWIAGLALPLVIWVAYLYLSYWGIANDLFERCPSVMGATSQRECLVNAKSNAPSGSLAGRIQFDVSKGTLSAEITPKAAPQVVADAEQLTPIWHTPAWLLFLAQKAGQVVQVRFPSLFQGNASELAYSYSLHMVILYTFAGALLFAISFCLTPNANSLHRLYRDRLSKAFLFDPTRSARRARRARRSQSRPGARFQGARSHEADGSLRRSGRDGPDSRAAGCAEAARALSAHQYGAEYSGLRLCQPARTQRGLLRVLRPERRQRGDGLCAHRSGAGRRAKSRSRHRNGDFRSRGLLEHGFELDQGADAHACAPQRPARLLAEEPALRR